MLSLRPGNAHAAPGADDVLTYLVNRLRPVWPVVVLHVRGDCGSVVPTVYAVCERLGVSYIFGVRAFRRNEKSPVILAISVISSERTTRATRLTGAEREELGQLLAYLPGLRPLWSFSQDVYRLLDSSRTWRVAPWRYTWLRHDPRYQGVLELVEAAELLADPKLTKAMAFVQQPAGRQVRTNNHVKRMNRRLRFAEKVRYRWRRRRWVVRWVVLLLDDGWQQAAMDPYAGQPLAWVPTSPDDIATPPGPHLGRGAGPRRLPLHPGGPPGRLANLTPANSKLANRPGDAEKCLPQARHLSYHAEGCSHRNRVRGER
jgi:hypothetical protein